MLQGMLSWRRDQTGVVISTGTISESDVGLCLSAQPLIYLMLGPGAGTSECAGLGVSRDAEQLSETASQRRGGKR